MGRTEFLTLTIRSEPRLESANQPRERNGALQQECMHSCAHTVIDIADIVRDGDFSPTTSPEPFGYNAVMDATQSGSDIFGAFSVM